MKNQLNQPNEGRLPAPFCSAWISVLARLPEPNTMVLVWASNGREEARIAALASPMDAGRWLTAYWCADIRRNAFAHVYDSNGNPSPEEVSHWMPLPSSPNAIGEARADNATSLHQKGNQPMKTPTEYATPVVLDRLVRLSSNWRELADLCDSEIQRTKTTLPTLIMSDDEKERYEQAARTYRFCADALDSETNVSDQGSAHGFFPAPITEQILANDTGDSGLIHALVNHARRCESERAWYQARQEKINDLRWHLNKIIERCESHNAAAKRLGWGEIPQVILILDDAKDALDKADEAFYFEPNVQDHRPLPEERSRQH